MTREEAIEKAAAVELLAAGAPTSYTNKVIAHNFVAIAQALGVLTLDEPKSQSNLAFVTIAKEFELFNSDTPPGNINPGFAAASMLRALTNAGLKIVEK